MSRLLAGLGHVSSVKVCRIGALTILMTLNLDNHLLQAPDGLFPPLPGHLALQIILGTILVLLAPLLVFIRDVLPGSILQRLLASLRT